MNMKSCHTCTDNPVLALFLVRLGVGLFFLLFGAMKLFIMGPVAVSQMMVHLFGFQLGLANIAAWLVILTELVGGILVILGKLIPRILYKFSLLGFSIITVVGFISAHMGTEDMMKQLLWHGMLLLAIFGLFVARPKSPCGICGDKTCLSEKCE